MSTDGNPKNDGAVLIQDYDVTWPEVFSKLAARVKAALGSLVIAVEHVGSASVAGPAAKPVIDLDIILRSRADLREAIRAASWLARYPEPVSKVIAEFGPVRNTAVRLELEVRAQRKRSETEDAPL
jgi:GrpB-like predicted nucleotidyltransferase (UPF0157 family)